jgi:hypothetical protein
LGTALVLMDVMQGGLYLTGFRLGQLIKRLIWRGMRVVVTLDCCSLGRTFRRPGNGIWTAEDGFDLFELQSDMDADTMAEKEDEVDEKENDPEVHRSVEWPLEPGPSTDHRNADVKQCWLMDPTNYCVLTACSVNQFAEDHSFREGII